MSGANKILTVSYGTFSCTIEGFDDPFGTMKQIAEYFRDLAAEDRYFGAEPPVPDAEALRHIAEREAARRVEARMGTAGVHLRQLDDAVAAATAMPVNPVPVQAAPAPSPAAAGLATGPVAAAPVLTPSEVIDPAPETVADRLSRIRAVVARARTVPAWPQEVWAQDGWTQDDAELAEPADMAPAAAAPAPAAAAPAPAPVAPAAAAPDVAPPAVATAPETAATPDSEPAPVLAAPVPDPTPDLTAHMATDADADARVETVSDPVADMVAAPADDLADDLAADPDHELAAVADVGPHPDTAPDAPADLDLVAMAATDAADDTADNGAERWMERDPVPASAPDDGADDSLTDWGIPAWTGGTAERSQDPAQDRAADAVADLSSDLPGGLLRPDLPAARIAVMRRDDHAAAEATDRLEPFIAGEVAVEDLYADDAAATPVAAPAAATADAPAGSDDETDSLLRAIRAIGESAGATAVASAGTQDDTPDVTPDDLRADAAASDDLPSLADDDDGTPLLLRADAAVHGDDAAARPDGTRTTDDTGAADTDDDDGPRTTASDDFDRVPEDASVDRLLAATNSQLASTEMNRRRSAIAHLKAAVAAARADRGAPEDTAGDDPAPEASSGSVLDKFREDLARVVRPRRPVDQDQPRPTRRLPPLMLVSEQRIDLDRVAAPLPDAAAGPVRPRRVSTREVGEDDTPGATATGGFADFAQAMGARDLPDMLEAAAAYSAFVEGRPSFSRPQLMQMMRAGDATDDAFSREEQLRSFGLLLRQGRIQKLKRGQFTVADDTRFRPTQRHAGE